MTNIAGTYSKKRNRLITDHGEDFAETRSGEDANTGSLTSPLAPETPGGDDTGPIEAALPNQTATVKNRPDAREAQTSTTTTSIAQIAAVPDLNPFIEREARAQRGLYMMRLCIFLYFAGLSLYLVRVALGNIPDVPLFVPVTTIALGAGSLLLIVIFRNSKWQEPMFALFSLMGAGILTFSLIYYGPRDTFSAMYILTLLVPMLFLSLPWALFTVTGVSVLILIPFLWGPEYSDAAIMSQLAVRIPIYFVLTLAANLALSGARTQWREANKHRRLTRDLAVLQELTTYIASTHNIQAICNTVVDHLHRSFGYSFISIYLLEGDKLRLITQHGYEHFLPALPLGKGVMSRVATSGKPLVIRDAKAEADFIYDAPSIRCEVCVPIIKRGGFMDDGRWTMDDKSRSSSIAQSLPLSAAKGPSSANTVLGVINLEDTVANTLGEADQNLLAAVAGALSVALENATLMQEWQERGERLALVNEVSHAVAAKLDLPGVLHAARERLQALVPVDRATLSLLTEDGGSMEIAAVEGLNAPNLSRKGTVIPLATFEPASVLEGRWLVLPKLPPKSAYPFVQNLYGAGLRSHLSIPLLSGDRVVGLFALSSFQPNAYTNEHMPLFESIAPHLATAVQNAQLYRAIKLRAETDSLTGLLNLPTFYARLKELLAEADPQSSLSVVMLDLDQFKSYNDSFGHVAGDSVLRQVAALIKNSLGPNDIAARYGGDEFALIIPGLRAEESLERVTHVCETIGRTPFQPEDDPDDILLGSGSSGGQSMRGVAILSASAGIASYPDNGSDSEELVHLADNALYEAKRRGRNRACVYMGDGNSLVGSDFKVVGPDGGIRNRPYNGKQPPSSKRFRSITDTDPELDAYEGRELRAASNEYLQAVYAMASAIELRDGYTHGHVERVAFYATRLGEAIGLDAAEVAALRIAGLLHDIGKLTLPHDIAHKSDKLTDKEWELMRLHPLQGETILRPLRDFSRVWPIVSAHHENYDGSGYPHGLAKAAIPIGGRILHVADAYEVMTVAGRPHHKRAKSPTEAVAELKRCAGTMFDPDLVTLFINKVVGDPTKRIQYNPETRRLSEELLAEELLKI